MATETIGPPELETLRIDIDGEVGTLTLDRPDALNALSPEMIDEFAEVAAQLADRAPLRALIVTGAGDARSRPAATSTGSSAASRTTRSTFRRASGGAPRCCTRGSSTSSASRIR